MNKSAKNMESISELLPDGLSDSAISEIAELVNQVIVEQVSDKVNEIETKVKSFLRMKVDEIKEHALKELETENDVFKNARLFESVKTLMAMEINHDDEDTAIGGLVKEQEEYQEEVSLLSEELQKSFVETEKLENLVGALSNKIDNLEEEKGVLKESIETLEEAREKPFKSSEQAVVISEDVDAAIEAPKDYLGNQFLTDEVMKLVPFTSNHDNTER